MNPRKDTDALLAQAARHTITVLIGSRQVGKSTLMQILRERLGGDSAYYNLENPLHLALFNEGYTSFIRQNTAPLIFIDEFQYCKDISSVFKAIYDLNPEIKVYASGSSSLEIQSHLKESLVGRKSEKIVYPLTFSEWLARFAPDASVVPELPPIGIPGSVDDQELYRNRMLDFIRFGAMPGLLQYTDETEKREYLQGIYQTYIAKDIKSFLKDESILAFNRMLSYLALNNGTLLNKNTLSTMAGISSRQVDRHIEVLEGTFVLSLVKPLSGNGNKELVKTPKFFLYDQGVINAIVQDFRQAHLRPDQGALYEQFVYWELKKNLDVRFQIKYWRTADGKEVDFIIEKDREFLPVEVKSAWPAGKIPPGLMHFFASYPDTKMGVVLYDGPDREVETNGRKVVFAPLFKAAKAGDLLDS